MTAIPVYTVMQSHLQQSVLCICSAAERSKMMDILRRVREEEDVGQELQEGEEGEDPGNLENRLAGLDLGRL